MSLPLGDQFLEAAIVLLKLPRTDPDKPAIGGQAGKVKSELKLIKIFCTFCTEIYC